MKIKSFVQNELGLGLSWTIKYKVEEEKRENEM
jgi:hypothetical protein